MTSLLLLLFIVDILLIGLINSIEGTLLLVVLLPWTLILYGVLCLPGILFSADDQIQQLAGKLYWIGRGNIQATILTIINVVLGALLVPNSSLILFEDYFGVFTSTLLFLILPLPGFFINSLQTENHERLYGLIYQEMMRSKEIPEFIEYTSELLSKTSRYTEEYFNNVEEVRKQVFKFIEDNFYQIATFFEQTKPLRLNLENLAIFLTKKMAEIPEI